MGSQLYHPLQVPNAINTRLSLPFTSCNLKNYKTYFKYNPFENKEHEFLSMLSPVSPQILLGADKSANVYFIVARLPPFPI